LIAKLLSGKLGSSFGVHGGIKVKSLSGELAHLVKLAGQSVTLKREHEEEFKVVKAELKGQIAVLYFEGINSPEEVKLLTGSELWLTRRQAAALANNEYYVADLIGLKVVFKGEVIAAVVAYSEAAHILLELKLNNGRPAYLPFIAHFVGKVDLNGGTIELLNDDCLFSE